MKIRIGVLTIILILVTIYSFANFVGFINDNKSLNSYEYNYENCTNTEDYEDATDVATLLNKQKFCKYIDQTLFKHYQSMFFIFLFLTILSWRFDLINNLKKK